MILMMMMTEMAEIMMTTMIKMVIMTLTAGLQEKRLSMMMRAIPTGVMPA